MFILTVVTYKMLNSLNFPCQFVNPCLTNMQCLEEKIEWCWCLIFMFLWSSNHINFSPNSGFTEVQLEFSPFVPSFDLIHRRRAWLTFHSISDFDFDRVPIWLEPMLGLHAVGTVNFSPRSVHQSKTGHSSTSSSTFHVVRLCADGYDGNHGDGDDGRDGGLACPMNKEKSGNESKKPRTSSDCTCSSGSNALLALRPTPPTF